MNFSGSRVIMSTKYNLKLTTRSILAVELDFWRNICKCLTDVKMHHDINV